MVSCRSGRATGQGVPDLMFGNDGTYDETGQTSNVQLDVFWKSEKWLGTPSKPSFETWTNREVEVIWLTCDLQTVKPQKHITNLLPLCYIYIYTSILQNDRPNHVSHAWYPSFQASASSIAVVFFISEVHQAHMQLLWLFPNTVFLVSNVPFTISCGSTDNYFWCLRVPHPVGINEASNLTCLCCPNLWHTNLWTQNELKRTLSRKNPTKIAQYPRIDLFQVLESVVWNVDAKSSPKAS